MSAFDIGVLVHLKEKENLFTQVAGLGLNVCQLCCWDMELYTEAISHNVRRESEQSNVAISAIWAGWTGERIWNLVQGPNTLGIVPPQYRSLRVDQLKLGADFAQRLGVRAIITHLGFIPENSSDPLYSDVIEVVRDIAQYCHKRGLEFWFESGQETPVTLLRLIEDVEMPNLGINFDTANVVLYGKGNPLDSTEIFGKYIKNLHAKDGFYPTNPRKLGREVPLGEGKANFPEILKVLKNIGFDGEIIIEREISGPQQIKDIEQARLFLDKCLRDLHLPPMLSRSEGLEDHEYKKRTPLRSRNSSPR